MHKNWYEQLQSIHQQNITNDFHKQQQQVNKRQRTNNNNGDSILSSSSTTTTSSNINNTCKSPLNQSNLTELIGYVA